MLGAALLCVLAAHQACLQQSCGLGYPTDRVAPPAPQVEDAQRKAAEAAAEQHGLPKPARRRQVGTEWWVHAGTWISCSICTRLLLSCCLPCFFECRGSSSWWTTKQEPVPRAAGGVSNAGATGDLCCQPSGSFCNEALARDVVL